jgi:HlyD family secretion protein
MKAPVRRRVFVITIGLLVSLAVGYGFLPKPALVDVATAKRGPLRVTVEEEGRCRVKDRFVLSAPVPGYLRRIRLEVGDRVSRGQEAATLEPLRSGTLDPRTRAGAEAAVAAARAALDAAQEKVRAAEAEQEYARERNVRMKRLAADGYISQDDLDQSDAEAKKAEALRLSSMAAVTAARADLDRAESVLRYSAAEPVPSGDKLVVIGSPVKGSVLKLHHESECVVNAGDPILDIGDPRNLEVRVEVLSADAVRIQRGMPVLFERWGGNGDLAGRVRVVEPAAFTKISSLGVEEQRVVVIADLSSPAGAWEGLGDGYRLDSSFILWEGTDVLQVPSSALFRSKDGWAVFTVENDRARLTPVSVGHRNGLSAEIVSGLAEGAAVITHPDDSVREGGSVRVR